MSGGRRGGGVGVVTAVGVPAVGPRVDVPVVGALVVGAGAVGDGRAFEVPDNAGWLLSADGSETELPSGSKAQLASRVWDAVATRLRPR